jgi:phenylacetate-CoA ligase
MSIAQKYRSNNILEKAYNNSPKFIQDFIYSGFGYFKMKELKQIRKIYVVELEEEDKLSKNEIEKKQLEKFKTLFKHARTSTKYYERLASEYQLTEDSFQSLEDLKKLPILEKNQVIVSQKDFWSNQNENYNAVTQSTGGTTGSTLNFKLDKEAYFKKEAEIIHYWNRHNFFPGKEKSIMFRAGVIIPPGKKIKSPWRIDHTRKMLYFSSYYASDALFSDYVKIIKKWNPTIMNGLPSALYLFAQYLNKHQIKLPLRKVMTASEMLHSFQREAIEEAFDCKIFDHYGHGEPGMYGAGQCNLGHYHIPTSNVIVEVSDDGHLIETSLNNFSMPFIRYKVGDVIDGIHHNCDCGIKTPFFKTIHGRESSFVFTADGRKISTIGFDQIFKGNNILLGQIIQEKKGEFILKIVPTEAFKEADQKNIIDKLKKRVGQDSKIYFNKVKEIPKAQSGKYNLVLTKLQDER